MSQQNQPPYSSQDPGAEMQSRAPKRRSKLLRFVVVLVVVFGGLGITFWRSQDAPVSASVGECVTGDAAEELEIVDCGSAQARWKVVGRLQDKKEADMESACLPFKETERTYWQGRSRGVTPFVLCLAPAR